MMKGLWDKWIGWRIALWSMKRAQKSIAAKMAEHGKSPRNDDGPVRTRA